MKKNLSSNMSDGKVKFLSKNIFIPLTIIGIVAFLIRLYYFQWDLPISEDAIQYFINKGKDSLNYINIGVESRTYVRDIVRIVIEEMGHKADIEYTGGDRGWVGDVPNFRYSVKKMNRLGWKAKLLSDESVRKAVQEILNSRKQQ